MRSARHLYQGERVQVDWLWIDAFLIYLTRYWMVPRTTVPPESVSVSHYRVKRLNLAAADIHGKQCSY